MYKFKQRLQENFSAIQPSNNNFVNLKYNFQKKFYDIYFLFYFKFFQAVF